MFAGCWAADRYSSRCSDEAVSAPTARRAITSISFDNIFGPGKYLETFLLATKSTFPALTVQGQLLPPPLIHTVH